jgi:oxygen-independent coproporphyrinogen-3 oxidase
LLLTAPPLALYVHIPWCVKKCPYCDFNSHAANGALPVDEYVDALLADLDRDLADFGAAIGNRAIGSVFFGGGTPSLFAAAAIGRILDGTAARIALSDGAEITLETNPGTVEHDRFEGYRAAGVNRISFGVQSFDDDKLRRLGRIHSAGQAERAIGEAQAAGFDNINLDLMYALPQQTLAQALADIEHAIALAPTHLSHYQLTLEPNTQFAARPPPLPDPDAAWDIEEQCQARLAEAGYAQYEVSAYARAGRECAHNVNYWSFGDYLGIGAGAHGKLTDVTTGTIVRTTKLRAPRSYLARAAQAAPFGSHAPVDERQRPFEFMLNALRLGRGIDVAVFEQRTGIAAGALAGLLAQAHALGWLEDVPGRLCPSALGRRFLNDLTALFLEEGAGGPKPCKP